MLILVACHRPAKITTTTYHHDRLIAMASDEVRVNQYIDDSLNRSFDNYDVHITKANWVNEWGKVILQFRGNTGKVKFWNDYKFANVDEMKASEHYKAIDEMTVNSTVRLSLRCEDNNKAKSKNGYLHVRATPTTVCQ